MKAVNAVLLSSFCDVGSEECVRIILEAFVANHNVLKSEIVIEVIFFLLPDCDNRQFYLNQLDCKKNRVRYCRSASICIHSIDMHQSN